MDLKPGKGRLFVPKDVEIHYITRWSSIILAKIVFVKDSNSYDVLLKDNENLGEFRKVGSTDNQLAAGKLIIGFIG